jgi:transposase
MVIFRLRALVHLALSAITTVYEIEERGYPPYHPVMLTKSRKIQRRLIEDVAFRVLAAGNTPDFRTIADFRQTHLAASNGFFEQVLPVARDLGRCGSALGPSMAVR